MEQLLRKRRAKRAQLDKVKKLKASLNLTAWEHSSSTSTLPFKELPTFIRRYGSWDDNLAAGIPEDILDKELEGAKTFSHRVVTAAAKQRCHIRDAECPRSS